jgi:hypothetical protein
MKKAEKIKNCHNQINDILNNSNPSSSDVELAFSLVCGILVQTGNEETADLLNRLVNKHVPWRTK